MGRLVLGGTATTLEFQGTWSFVIFMLICSFKKKKYLQKLDLKRMGCIKGI